MPQRFFRCRSKKNWLLEERKKLFPDNSRHPQVLSSSAVSSQMQSDGHLSVMTMTILFSAMTYQETPLFPVCFFFYCIYNLVGTHQATSCSICYLFFFLCFTHFHYWLLITSLSIFFCSQIYIELFNVF